MPKKIKKILKRVLTYVKKHISIFKLKQSLISTDKNKIIYIGSPLHGNIGDHAISIAIMDLLKEFNMPIVEIPGERYMFGKKIVIEYIKPTDIIVITGGGLIGNLWMNEEEMIKDVIGNFRNNKIIIMPQTYYFDSNAEGKEELKSLKQVIDSHNNIYLCSREENSYNFCENSFKNIKGNYLLPDVVLTMNYSGNYERKDVLLVLRADKEKSFDSEQIFELLKDKNIKSSTTVINKRISLSKRESIFLDKLQEFKNSELVITDRLHAMIFSAITGTPCIALDNKSKKISGVYKWLEGLEYIVFCKDIKDIKKIIHKIDFTKIYNYNLSDEYTSMIKNLLNELL